MKTRIERKVKEKIFVPMKTLRKVIGAKKGWGLRVEATKWDPATNSWVVSEYQAYQYLEPGSSQSKGHYVVFLNEYNEVKTI